MNNQLRAPSRETGWVWPPCFGDDTAYAYDIARERARAIMEEKRRPVRQVRIVIGGAPQC